MRATQLKHKLDASNVLKFRLRISQIGRQIISLEIQELFASKEKREQTLSQSQQSFSRMVHAKLDISSADHLLLLILQDLKRCVFLRSYLDALLWIFQQLALLHHQEVQPLVLLLQPRSTGRPCLKELVICLYPSLLWG